MDILTHIRDNLDIVAILKKQFNYNTLLHPPTQWTVSDLRSSFLKWRYFTELDSSRHFPKKPAYCQAEMAEFCSACFWTFKGREAITNDNWFSESVGLSWTCPSILKETPPEPQGSWSDVWLRRRAYLAGILSCDFLLTKQVIFNGFNFERLT